MFLRSPSRKVLHGRTHTFDRARERELFDDDWLMYEIDVSRYVNDTRDEQI